MSARDEFAADLRLLGSGKVTINSATTTSIDFGTPDDLYLPNIANYHAGNRILVIFRSTTAGTTNAISFVVQDAPDSSGSIGTPTAALTDGTLTGGTGDQTAATAVLLQYGRPWLRCRATGVGSPDRHVVSALVYALPGVL